MRPVWSKMSARPNLVPSPHRIRVQHERHGIKFPPVTVYKGGASFEGDIGPALVTVAGSADGVRTMISTKGSPRSHMRKPDFCCQGNRVFSDTKPLTKRLLTPRRIMRRSRPITWNASIRRALTSSLARTS